MFLFVFFAASKFRGFLTFTLIKTGENSLRLTSRDTILKLFKMKEEILVDVSKEPSYVIVNRHLKDLKQFGNRCQGYVSSKEDLDSFLEDLRIASGTSFVTRDSDSRVSTRYCFFNLTSTAMFTLAPPKLPYTFA